MPESSDNEILQLVNEIARRTARIQPLASQIAAAHTLDRIDADILETHLDNAIDALKSVQRMASYLSRPVKETSRLWRNGSGQYETTAGFCFREGSPIEILVPDKYNPGRSRWERTYLRYDGRDYYLADHTELFLEGLGVRVREGDRP